MKSPEFDYFDYEPILKWANAKVEYNDKFVSDGIVKSIPKFGSYSLIWENGVIYLNFKKDEETKARMCAALFIYLWTRGVECSIAIECSKLYSDYIKIKRL